MKQEDKELLQKDLCARLPYGVKCQAHNGTLICVNANNGIAVVQSDRGARQVLIENLNPYLRPISSMTEEEEDEYEKFIRGSFEKKMEFYLRKHFDFCGLIPKGLALEAPEGMYEIK